MTRARRWWSAPLLIPLALTDQRHLIDADARRWNEIMRSSGMLTLLARREFRTLLLYRLRRGRPLGWIAGRLLMTFYRPEPTLELHIDELGPGFFVQHGIATNVTARRVGANCWINQQVTVGWRDSTGCPILEDGVSVGAGARVLGPITVGRGSRIGANAVVVRDVPPGVTAVGVPARHLPAPADGDQ